MSTRPDALDISLSTACALVVRADGELRSNIRRFHYLIKITPHDN